MTRDRLIEAWVLGVSVRLTVVLVVALCAAACGGGVLGAAAKVVDQVVEKNNAAVVQLRAVQESARQSRKAALILAAKTATSVEDGHRRMDRVDAAYRRVFAALRAASKYQQAVGKALEAAQEALRRGEVPSVAEVLTLLSDVQAAVLTASMAVQEVASP